MECKECFDSFYFCMITKITLHVKLERKNEHDLRIYVNVTVLVEDLE